MFSAITHDTIFEILRELGFKPMPAAERRMFEYEISHLTGFPPRAPKALEWDIFGFSQGMTLARTHDAAVWIHPTRTINLSGLGFCDCRGGFADIERLHLQSVAAAYRERKECAAVN